LCLREREREREREKKKMLVVFAYLQATDTSLCLVSDLLFSYFCNKFPLTEMVTGEGRVTRWKTRKRRRRKRDRKKKGMKRRGEAKLEKGSKREKMRNGER